MNAGRAPGAAAARGGALGGRRSGSSSWRPTRCAALERADRRRALRPARRRRRPRSDVVIVGIDDKTLDADPNATFPFDRRRDARVIRQLTKAGAEVIAYDVQFTEPSQDAGRRQRADHRRARGCAARGARHDRGREPGGKTAIFGGGEGLEVQPRDARLRAASTTTRTASMRHMPSPSSTTASTASRSRRRAEARARRRRRRATAPGSTSPARRARSRAQLRRRRARQLRHRRRARQGRHRRRDGRRRCRTCTRRRPDDAMTGPEIEAPAIATALDGLPAPRRRGLGRLAARRRARLPSRRSWRCASERRRRCSPGLAGRRRCSSSAPRSRSTTATIAGRVPPLAAAAVGLVGTRRWSRNPAAHPCVEPLPRPR